MFLCFWFTQTKNKTKTTGIIKTPECRLHTDVFRRQQLRSTNPSFLVLSFLLQESLFAGIYLN